ncbi:MAG: [FeFe] hydrogenase H-cluster radical SAM maturase HydE [Oscillospiraceae bacterium]|nr:[FeFe] hydrogenase H-cluster radical SAM maturase HydE [Oscillospiraceae bacterium]
MRKLTDKLAQERILSRGEFAELLTCEDDYLHEAARKARENIYGNKIFLRGLIEFTSYCKNDCFYCGLRRSNSSAARYRLSKEQILNCCDEGYDAGYRTFVLQGGEDAFFTDEILTDIIRAIKCKYPDCALTLSTGERGFESLKLLREAGADRYLLRHETADSAHYAELHPPEMQASARQKCLRDLKELGFQTGCGFMVGSPKQTLENIVSDLLFIKELDPEMVGVGPFIPHSATPFAKEKAGNLKLVLNILAILRLMKPSLLLPATTALATIENQGYELGINAGANVIMQNISPLTAREKYKIYDNKIGASENLKQRIKNIGCEFTVARGDYFNYGEQ